MHVVMCLLMESSLGIWKGLVTEPSGISQTQDAQVPHMEKNLYTSSYICGALSRPLNTPIQHGCQVQGAMLWEQ